MFPLSCLRTILASGLILAVCTSPSPARQPEFAAPPTSTETLPWLPTRTRMEELLHMFDVPGIALVGLSDCRPRAPINVGAARLAPPAPVTDRTVFEAASLSKPVMAYLVMQLVEEGVIALDRPFAQDMPYPRITDQERYRRITPRMVLSHQTGLPNWAGDSDDLARTDILAFDADPGSAYSYSGEAYELLRAYVEYRTGETLDSLFRIRLGASMPLSAFAPPLSPEAAPAQGYARARDPASGRGLDNLRDGGGGAAGGLVTTASDYARFIARMCDRQGLTDTTFDTMLTPQVPVPPGDYPAPTSYGLGWAIMRMGPETVVLHGGNNDEFRSFAAFSPDSREGLVILTNGRNGSDLIDDLLEEMQ